MGHIWISYFFDMGHYITHHIKPIILWCHVLPLYCLIYGKDTYFVKIHTIPRYGNDMGYGMITTQKNDMGMVWEVQSVSYLTHIYGKDTYFVKIHTISIHSNSIIFRQTQPITLKKAKAYLSLVKYLSSSLILGIFLKQLNSWELARQGTAIERFSFQLGLLIQFQGCSVSFTIKNKIH